MHSNPGAPTQWSHEVNWRLWHPASATSAAPAPFNRGNVSEPWPRVEVDAKEIRVKERITAHAVAARRAKTAGFGAPGFVPEVVRHGRLRWARLLRRGAMMPQPTKRSDRKIFDPLRFCATPGCVH